jgi:hypothetical protein
MIVTIISATEEGGAGASSKKQAETYFNIIKKLFV